MAAKKKNWIAGVVGKNPGALHRALNVPIGQTIPPAKVAKAAASGGKVGKEARLAQTLAGFKKK